MSVPELIGALEEVAAGIADHLDDFDIALEVEEIGRIRRISQGIVWAEGLDRVRSEELVVLGEGTAGMVLDILPDRIGIVLLGSDEKLKAGDEVSRTGRVLEVPVHESLAGRVIDPLGNPLDGKGPLPNGNRLPVQREAPGIMARAPVDTPLESGIKVIDALLPIGRGQRELILGDRQTGKTAVAVDAIVNQRGKDVLCIYCAIGQRSAAIAKVIDDLARHGALDFCVVVVAEGSDVPGLQYVAPYAATSIGEFFMAHGRDVLIVYDDITRHAQAYRQISLLMRRPPGREAFPGDIFYIHSRLLERSTHLRPEHGGGSMTALPIIETEAQNISAYIPTNLISITDGQIYLSPELFQKGLLPAIEVGRSVSRVGGKAQPPPYRKVAGDLRLSYSQYQELESFSRFGTKLDEDTKKKLAHGRIVREILKQDQFSALTAVEQIGVLYAVNEGLLDQLPLQAIARAEEAIAAMMRSAEDLVEPLLCAGKEDAVWDEILTRLTRTVSSLYKEIRASDGGRGQQTEGGAEKNLNSGKAQDRSNP